MVLLASSTNGTVSLYWPPSRRNSPPKRRQASSSRPSRRLWAARGRRSPCSCAAAEKMRRNWTEALAESLSPANSTVDKQDVRLFLTCEIMRRLLVVFILATLTLSPAPPNPELRAATGVRQAAAKNEKLQLKQGENPAKAVGVAEEEVAGAPEKAPETQLGAKIEQNSETQSTSGASRISRTEITTMNSKLNHEETNRLPHRIGVHVGILTVQAGDKATCFR